MAAKNRTNQRKHLKSGGSYSCEELRFLTMQRDKLQIISMHLSQIETRIAMIDEKLGFYRQKYAGIISHLTTMAGITPESALYILGETGTDMSVWRDDASLACWAGLSPANNAGAGKKKSTSESADASQPIQESVNGSSVLISNSQQGHALNHHSKDPAAATAAA